MQTLPTQRTPLDLLDLENIFSQSHLLDAEQLREACNRRGLWLPYGDLAEQQMEALHRAGVLIPLYRVVKNMPELRRRAKEENVPPWFFMGRGTIHGLDLRIERDAGRVHDPRVESFKPWRRYERQFENGSAHTCEFLYSSYQLLLIERIRSLVAIMQHRRLSQGDHHYELKLPQHARERIHEESACNDELVLALSVLDRIYRPRIVRLLKLPRPGTRGQEEWELFESSFDPVAMLTWLGWSADRVRNEAEQLLHAARSLDPLGDWLSLIRLCHPKQWELLRGGALVAMDHRIAAEILLRFYEDLASRGVAPELPQIPRFASHEFQERLKTDRQELDAVLMKYGLSPHPSLVLFLEGQTEMYIVPRVIELLRMRWPRSFIEIHNGHGTQGNIGRLASYMAPLTFGEAHGDFVELTRPATRFLVVFDRENAFASSDGAEEARQKWLDELFKAVPTEYQTPTLRDAIDSQIDVITWDGGSFEFAHYSDDELQQAITAACHRLGIPVETIEDWKIKDARARKLSIETVFPGKAKRRLTKLELARELWTILEQQIHRAIETRTLESIPLVGVLTTAIDQAIIVHRSNVGVPLHIAPEHTIL